MTQTIKYRSGFLDLALECGAVLTGKPDGSEPIEVHFTIDAWRKFDITTRFKTINDVQWMNIVNHDHAWENSNKEEAVHEVVKMTEAKLKEINGHGC